MFSAADPVASGMQFALVAVNGCAPRDLDDVVGTSHFTLRCAQRDRLVDGCGYRDCDAGRFTKKDVSHGGTDVRVGAIDFSHESGRFTARTTR